MATAATPVTFGGLADPEVRYRQRYADLAVHPEVREVFRLRARAVVDRLRPFLDGRGFLEVETPVLQPLYGGAAARPFVTHHNALDMPLYLRIADELYLKRLIVGGLERVYEIGHDFRNEGMDRTHNPEFTMLECYQAYADYHDMMDLDRSAGGRRGRATAWAQPWSSVAAPVLDFTPPWPRVSLRRRRPATALASTSARLDAGMRERCVRASGVPADDVGQLRRRQAASTRCSRHVRSNRRSMQPTFVVDYPLAALAARQAAPRAIPRLTERFELFVHGRELANAFSELNDPDDQRRALRGPGPAARRRRRRGAAVRRRLPPRPGVRHAAHRRAGHRRRPLVMLLTDQPSIRDVILFPAMRPEG